MVKKNTEQSLELTLALLAQRLDYISSKLDSLADKMENDFVTKSELLVLINDVKILQKIVYTTVGLVLIAFITGLVRVIF